jgi:hypothetical protein
MHEQDISPIPHTADGRDQLTVAEVRAYLADGYAAEAEQMIADAVCWANYRYSDDRHRYVARTAHTGGTGRQPEDWAWVTGDCTEGEERIKAIGRRRRGELPLGTPVSVDGRLWH